MQKAAESTQPLDKVGAAELTQKRKMNEFTVTPAIHEDA